MRIISLIASATEIVCALGFRDSMVGRSHECDYPEDVKDLPPCSEPKFDIEGTSKEIDDRVKKIVQESLSVYRVHTDKLQELKPDVIVTQDHCEVCAVSLKDVEEAVCNLVESKPKIVALEPNDIQDVFKGIEKVAEALGEREKGIHLVHDLRARMQNMAIKAKQTEKKPSVACIEWVEPLMAAGNWVPEFVEMLGGQNLFGEPGKHSPWMTFEELVAKDPDVIMVMPCGWDIERSMQEMPTLMKKPEWKKLTAVQNKQVYMTDGNQFFNRPGPRLVESMEIMAEILHPELFQFGHQGKGWEKLEKLTEGDLCPK